MATRYTQEQKDEALRKYAELRSTTDRSHDDIARELHLAPMTLYKWNKKAKLATTKTRKPYTRKSPMKTEAHPEMVTLQVTPDQRPVVAFYGTPEQVAAVVRSLA